MSWFRLLLVALVFAGFQAAAVSFPFAPAIAQTATSELDYAEWERVATRAESVLEDRRASNVALGELRDDIVEWRVGFLAAQSANQTRIETVRTQLEALGPAPEEGAKEAADIAQRRIELDEQLARLEAPGRKADEAFSRANGIVAEIDAIIRERQAQNLYEIGPSPFDPANWAPAVRSISQTISDVSGEITSAWTSATQQAEIRDSLPATLFYLVIALVLLGRGRHWMERLTLRVQGRAMKSITGFKGFLISLGQVILPVIGLMALVEALFSTKLLGFRGQILLQGIPLIGIAFYSAMWLSIRLFPKFRGRPGLLNLGLVQRRELRFYAVSMGVLYSVTVLLNEIAAFEGYADASVAVMAFPILFLTCLALFRVGQILVRSLHGAPDSNGDVSATDLRGRITSFIGRTLILIGVCAPVAAAVGYGTAASFIVYSTALSLALVGLLLVLHGVVRDLYALITGSSDDGANEALIPVLVSFGIMLASTPIFALIWGARTSDLTELWARFGEGVSIGDSRISPSDFLTFAVIFGLGFGLTRLLQGALRTTVLPKTKMDTGGKTAVVSGVGYIGIFIAAIVAISSAGIDLSSVAIVAGALSVGIGFGLQNIVSNFVSGIILLIERPISEGDWIEVGGQQGYVRNISVRSTRIETFDRSDVIVPNADLVSGTVTNFTRGNLIGRAIVPVGVAYGTDTRKVTEILAAIAADHPMVAMNPAPSVIFRGFGADSMDFEIRAILRDVNFTLSVKSEMNHEIARRFAEEGIEIPFAQRDVWLRNPEVLQPKTATAKRKAPPK